MPDFLVDFLDRQLVALNAGIIDQDIDTAVFGLVLADQRDEPFDIGIVAGHDRRLAAESAAVLRRFLRGVGIQIVHDNVRPAFGHQQSVFASHSPRGARDHSYPPVEAERVPCHRFSPLFLCL